MKRDYTPVSVEKETQDIANTPIGMDESGITKELRNAIEYVAFTAAKGVKLRAGQTALFWNLMWVVRDHIEQE